jgi:enolase
MMNIMNGGAHSDAPIDFQEFMIMPEGRQASPKACAWAPRSSTPSRSVLKKLGLSTAVGDEGGFAPNLAPTTTPSTSSPRPSKQGRLQGGKDIFLALDVASSEFYDKEKKKYVFKKSDKSERTGDEMVEYYAELGRSTRSSPSKTAAPKATGRAGRSSPTPSATSASSSATISSSPTPKFLKKGIDTGTANSILVKVNQIGSLTETLDAVEMAKRANYTAVISHRSGETEDATIADIAVATNAARSRPAP